MSRVGSTRRAQVGCMRNSVQRGNPAKFRSAIVSDWNPLPTKVTLSSGNVTAFADSMGRNNMSDGAIGGGAPAYNTAGPGKHPTLDFNGTSSQLSSYAVAPFSVALAQPFSMYMVYKQFQSAGVLWSDGGGCGYVQSADGHVTIFAGAFPGMPGALPPSGIYVASCMEYQTVSSKFYYNRSLYLPPSTVGVGAMDSVNIGAYQFPAAPASQWLQCGIARAILVNRLLFARPRLLNYMRAYYQTP